MSAANAAAIRRRVNNQNTPPPVPTNSKNGTPYQSTNGSSNQLNNGTPNQLKNMTLPQVINSLDQRIKTIEETFSNTGNDSKELDSKIIEEYNTRFEILASEIGELKDVIMKLQSFTMEVNKSLYDDRIRIMSDNINVTDTSLIHQIQDANSETINQSNAELNTTSADLKTMVKEEISSSNDL
jgi:hypothetical protein